MICWQPYCFLLINRTLLSLPYKEEIQCTFFLSLLSFLCHSSRVWHCFVVIVHLCFVLRPIKKTRNPNKTWIYSIGVITCYSLHNQIGWREGNSPKFLNFSCLKKMDPRRKAQWILSWSFWTFFSSPWSKLDSIFLFSFPLVRPSVKLVSLSGSS